MKDITSIAVTGENGVVTYANGSKEEFQYSRTVATIVTSLATALEKKCKMRIVTDDHLRHMYIRNSDMTSRSSDDTSATSTIPTAINAEFTRLVRAVALKYDSTLPDAGPRIVALDVLCYAPVEAFSAVHSTSISEIQLDRAIDVLEQIGDYVKANNIAPKIISTGDAIRSINADNATFWGKKH